MPIGYIGRLMISAPPQPILTTIIIGRLPSRIKNQLTMRFPVILTLMIAMEIAPA